MRANHATKAQVPAPGGVAGAHRGIARWLPRPRIVAAAGALLAQLWGVGAPGACAAAVEPLPDPARPAVRRALHAAPLLDRPAPGGPALGGPALDGQSAEHPVGSGPPTGGTPGRSPGPVGEGPVGGIAGAAGAAGAVSGTLQERIRAGGLPLPGQRAAVPDAFALASGLLDTAPAQARTDRPRASREDGPADAHPAARRREGAAEPAVPRQREAAAADPLLREAAATSVEDGDPGPAPGPAPAPPPPPGLGPAPAAMAIADTAAAAASGAGSATATAVLAPIAAGLLLTGAAMCKHRGLPSGH
ncbi:hypothetical protein [Kitasatospora sp. NPDC018619]|uniref:hypothetical protein n=1 Tax=unclassified Kitasatospora TaxID=2633591 RepID=UPI003788E472